MIMRLDNLAMDISRVGSSCLLFPSWIGIRNVGFCGGRKPEDPEKNPRSKEENQQKTQPTCNTKSVNRTRATVA